MRYRLAVTMGDAAGIGPEVVVKALADKGIYQNCIPVVVGDRAPLEDALGFCKSDLRLRQIETPGEAKGRWGEIEYLDTGLLKKGSWTYRQASVLAGEAAFQYIVRAIELAMAGEVHGVVTGPIHKEAVNRAGHHFSGHTEIFAEYTHTPSYGMLLTSPRLRVIHVTTHVALREACRLIQEEPQRVENAIGLARQAMELLGIAQPRIAVAGLNPHCSESGLFGTEEQNSIAPAIRKCRAAGMDVEGPVPPDTVFVKAMAGMYDVVVAMYHDQGHIPLKLSGFVMDGESGTFVSMAGVNSTIGLPIIRTSVDHGTAFDIAGKGIANEGSMRDAIDMAVQMAKVKYPEG